MINGLHIQLQNGLGLKVKDFDFLIKAWLNPAIQTIEVSASVLDFLKETFLFTKIVAYG
jgi:hypothetical protein